MLHEPQPSAYGTAALLAAVLGLKYETAETIFERINGRLRSLESYPLAGLKSSKGVGPSTTKRLQALVELMRRYQHEAVPDRLPLRGPKDVAAWFAPRLQDIAVEEFHVAILDAQHRLVRDVLITRGLMNSSLVHPREVFREAIAESAAAIILVHNHPSGDPTPSAEDRTVTEQLVAAGRLLDIPVHDHVIIGRGRYASFAELGFL